MLGIKLRASCIAGGHITSWATFWDSLFHLTVHSIYFLLSSYSCLTSFLGCPEALTACPRAWRTSVQQALSTWRSRKVFCSSEIGKTIRISYFWTPESGCRKCLHRLLSVSHSLTDLFQTPGLWASWFQLESSSKHLSDFAPSLHFSLTWIFTSSKKHHWLTLYSTASSSLREEYAECLSLLLSCVNTCCHGTICWLERKCWRDRILVVSLCLVPRPAWRRNGLSSLSKPLCLQCGSMACAQSTEKTQIPL